MENRTEPIWEQIAEDIAQLHQLVYFHGLYELIEGSINLPSGFDTRFPLESLHAHTYDDQVLHLTKWLSENCSLHTGPTLSMTLHRGATEEETLRFEQLQQFVHKRLKSIKEYTRKGRNLHTLLITFKGTLDAVLLTRLIAQRRHPSVPLM